MTVATYSPQPAQSHYGSPTIRPMQRQTFSNGAKPTRAQPQAQSQSRTKQMTSNGQPPRGSRPLQHIWVISGPAGCGKTSVGKALADRFAVPYVEGDEHHTDEARKKMGDGIPLTDADRWDWLIRLRDHAIEVLATPPAANPATSAATTHVPPPANSSTALPKAVVVTCSALKLKYRDEFRVAPTPIHSKGLRISVHFIYLAITEAESLDRVAARKGHYMKADMVKSQFASLEAPTAAERESDVIVVSVEQSPEAVMNDVEREVDEALEREEEEMNWDSGCGF